MSTFNRLTPKKTSAFLGLLLGLTGGHPLLADDVEIYLSEPPEPVPPNVLFVLDESGSMSSNNPSRRDQLVVAMRNIINDPDMGNVNAALLGYTTRWGNNGPLHLNAHTGNFKLIEDNRAEFLSEINELSTISFTPTVKALEQAVAWIRNDQTFIDAENNTMASPISGDPEDNWCKPNHIVLLSDGAPNSNSTSAGGAYGLNSYETYASCDRNWTSVWGNGRCAKEVAAWAYDTDLETGTGWNDQQHIITHTIGFNTNNQTRAFLTSIATEGGGNFYPAASATDLVSAFESILTNAQQSIPYAYTAPVIPFNQDNAAVSGDRIYVPMFVPTGSTFWKGNLKSYTFSTVTSGNSTDIALLDANGDPIVNDQYEFISSRDHWSSGTDGGDPLVNGAAAQMGSGGVTRQLYTNLDNTVPLSNIANRVSIDNIDSTMLGVATDEDRDDLVNWITWNWTAPPPPAGEDPEPSREGVMGAPLHTHPSVVTYGNDKVIYLPTTEGVLEAIDASTGQELWAFMPADLLPTISVIKNDNESTIPNYGLDGPLTVYETAGQKMAIVGMRRGGKSYYLLNITDRLNPTFVAQITDPNPTTPGDDFDGLGQTWSKPFLASMFTGSSNSDVLVFGGGYDTEQDTATVRSDDDEGNAIFIVNASTGALIRNISNATAGVSGMNNAIAADVLPFDMNRNGVMDRLYAADVGGRIVRIDIPENASGTISGGIIADINVGYAGAFRRFFNTPEVGYYNRNGIQYLAILIGTGNRPSPLDPAIADRFYMIKDPNVWTAPTTYVTVNEDNLYPITDNLVQDGDATEQATALSALAGSQGWYLDFGSTEKSFSEAVLYNYAVLFTTYSAERTNDLATCEARGATGVSRFYAINMLSGAAMFSGLGGNDSTLDRNDRSTVLSMLGIPPTPTLVFPEGQNGNTGGASLGDKTKALVGLQEVVEWPNQLIPIWWEEVIE